MKIVRHTTHRGAAAFCKYFRQNPYRLTSSECPCSSRLRDFVWKTSKNEHSH